MRRQVAVLLGLAVCGGLAMAGCDSGDDVAVRPPEEFPAGDAGAAGGADGSSGSGGGSGGVVRLPDDPLTRPDFSIGHVPVDAGADQGPPDAAPPPPPDAGASGGGSHSSHPVSGVSAYLIIDQESVRALRARFDARDTHPCELQVVGDSISESYLFLNPLTEGRGFPDMSYLPPVHCRIFGQPSIFLDVPQTASTGRTAPWGLSGDDGTGGVLNLHYPMTYMDRDGGRQPLGERQAWPEIATILFGTNDLREYLIDRYPWDPSAAGAEEARQTYLDSLQGMTQWFLDHGTIPVLVTPPPGTYDAWSFRIGDGPAMGPRWAASVRALGQKMGVPVFDLNQLMLDQGDWQSLLSDGVHPNDAGYDLINRHFHDVYQDLRRLVLVR